MEYQECEIFMEDVYQKIRKSAAKAKKDAAMSGDNHDGGSARMLEELKMYQMGIRRVFPSKWKPYLDNIMKKKDPEWETYKRLKEKFEN